MTAWQVASSPHSSSSLARSSQACVRGWLGWVVNRQTAAEGEVRNIRVKGRDSVKADNLRQRARRRHANRRQ